MATKRGKKWLFALLAVDERRLQEDHLPKGAELGSLPNMLDAAVEGLSPSGAVALNQVFLLTNSQKDVVVELLEEQSLPFHEYVVDERGEKCQESRCTQHHLATVIELHDRRSGSEGAV